MNGRPVYIVDGSRTPFIKARGEPGPFTPVDLAVACGRPLLAAPAVRAECVRPGDPRLRQRHRRRDEPGAHRGAAARHGRGDDRLHGADQLRLRHAVDRHRLPVHPRGQGRSDPGGRRGGAQPRAAGVQQAARSNGTRAMFAARDLWSRLKAIAGFRPSLLQAGDRPRARPDRPDRRSQHGTDGGDSRARVSHLAPRCRRIRGREPAPAREGAERELVRGRARAGLRRATERSTITTTACGRTARSKSSPSSSPRSNGRGAR